MASMAHPVEPLAPARTLRQRLAAVGGLVDAALVVVVPEVSGSAGVDGVAVAGIDQDFGDALGIVQADIGPVLAAVGGFVDAVADGDAVADPGFAGAHPHVLGIGGIDGDGADGLHGRVVEDGLESWCRRSPISRRRRWPTPTKTVSRPPSLTAATAAMRPLICGGADIARGQTGDGAGIEAHGRLREERGDGEQECEGAARILELLPGRRAS